MLRLLVTAGLIAAVSCCFPAISPPSVTNQDGARCKAALAPTAAEKQLDRAAVTTCIAEQAGLQAIIDSLRPAGSAESAASVEDTGNYDKNRHDVASLLEANGYTTEATKLRQCVAREKGMLNLDVSYNMDKLKTNILSKVTGLTVEAKTKLGLNACPAVVAFDVNKYMRCISTYCKTGAAP